MDIIQVHPDDASLVEGVVELYDAVDAVDSPWRHGLTPRFLRTLVTQGWDGEPMRFFAGVEEGQVVAAGELMTPMRDNVTNAWLGGAVHPQHRRRGLGTQMYDYLEALAAAEGRTVMGTEAVDNDGARAFAEARGYELKYVGVNRHQALADVPADLLDEAYEEAQAAATDYELVRIAGPLTDEQIEQTLAVVSAINDAPLDELIMEDEVFTADRVRDYDQAQLDRGMRMYRVWARHRDTGEVAGHTVVGVEAERPHLGDQHDTTVLPKHRGHRLGLLLKADMMRWLREVEPALNSIITDNAGSNAHMIAVNERLGYQVVGKVLEYQRVDG